MPPEGASVVDADRQESSRTLSPRLGLGALPRAAWVAPGMAVSQRDMTSPFPDRAQYVPGLFLSPGKRSGAEVALFPVFPVVARPMYELGVTPAENRNHGGTGEQ